MATPSARMMERVGRMALPLVGHESEPGAGLQHQLSGFLQQISFPLFTDEEVSCLLLADGARICTLIDTS